MGENNLQKSSAVTSRVLSVLLIITAFLFVAAFSIAIPIWFRPFYYMQIEPLGIVEYSEGFTKEQILRGFNELMNYLNFGAPFAMGDFAYSESGKAHFEDCKVLFDLDTAVLLISGAALIVCALLKKRGKLKVHSFFGYPFYFFSGLAGVVLPLVLGGLIAIDPDNAFNVFHGIFFAGKDNWHFDWDVDQIIRILPFEFFIACAVLIVAAMVIISGVCVVVAVKKRNK